MFEIFGDSFTEDQYNALSWEGLDEVEVIDNDGVVTLVNITEAWKDLTESEKNNIRDLQNTINKDCDNDGIENDDDDSKDFDC